MADPDPVPPPPVRPEPETSLARDGYAFVQADAMRVLLDPAALDRWDSFAASWDHLGLDRYMADGGRYRRRRHAVFAVGPNAIERKAHQPHYQSRDYNELNGGIERWFTPVEDAVANHPVLLAVLSACHALFDSLTTPGGRPALWHVELHQFRIEPSLAEDGQPTPEGLHRDGVDWVLVLLIARENIASGVTAIHDSQRHLLGSFTLRQPLDAAFVDDSRVYHGVTAIRPLDPALPAHRDVLVVTFRRQ
jgi:hypothetical protein